MMNHAKAEQLAKVWLELNTSDKAELINQETITKPYGWVFFYQSKKFLETGEFSEMLLGNSPILIDKINGELKLIGTANSVEEYLLEYEKTLPKAVLEMKPEFPSKN